MKRRNQTDEDADIDLSLTPTLSIPKEKFVRVYPDIDVCMTYQNFGSAWLCVLRGSQQNIDLVFNGLYNYGATNGDYQFFDHVKTVALFWSDYRGLRRFFANRMLGTNEKHFRYSQAKRAIRFAKEKIDYLRQYGHESFMDFSNRFEPVVYSEGRIRAENPDADFKDKVLAHAHKDKSL